MKKINILFLIIFLFVVTSCVKEKYINDTYEFTLNEENKNSYINNINKTSPYELLVYKKDNSISFVIISYSFNNGFSKTKTQYTFYNSINDYRKALNNHNNTLDGEYIEVQENILLIKTTYTTIEQRSYTELYKYVSSKYELI